MREIVTIYLMVLSFIWGDIEHRFNFKCFDIHVNSKQKPTFNFQKAEKGDRFVNK